MEFCEIIDEITSSQKTSVSDSWFFFGYWWFQVLIISKCMYGLQACLLKHITVAASHIYLSVVKMLLKGEVGGHVLKSHRNYIVFHGKSWKNHGIVFLNFCGNPAETAQSDLFL